MDVNPLGAEVPGPQRPLLHRAVAAFNAYSLKMKTNVYIDGLNLHNGIVSTVGDTPYQWLNPQVLVQALLPGVSISRIRYFTARVVSFPHDPDAPTRQRVYLRALETLPDLSITEGQFKKRMPWYPQFPLVYANGADPRSEPPLMVQVVRYEEKRTDVNLAAYLLADCFNGEYDQAVVTAAAFLVRALAHFERFRPQEYTVEAHAAFQR